MDDNETNDELLKKIPGMIRSNNEMFNIVQDLFSTISEGAELMRKNGRTLEEIRNLYERDLLNGLEDFSDSTSKLLYLKQCEVQIRVLRERSIANGMKGDQRHYDKLLNEKILPKVDLWKHQAELEQFKKKVKFPAHTKSKVKSINSNQSAFIWQIGSTERDQIIDQLIDAGCFKIEDRSLLIRVLERDNNGESEKIVVYGMKKRFPTVMFELEAKKIIRGRKQDIANWIVANFLTQPVVDGKKTPYRYATVYDALNDAKHEKRLHPSHREYIKIISPKNKP
jgi:hypothetical protein